MSSANPLNATFFAARKRERGGVLTQLAIAFSIGEILLWGAYVAIFASNFASFWPWLLQMIELSESGAEPQPEDFAIFGSLIWMMLALIPALFIHFVLRAMFEAGCLRWMTRGEVKGVMGLALDANSWRVYAVYWVNLALQMGVGIAVGLASAVLIGIAVVAGGGPESAEPVRVVLELIQNIALYYILMRLAPAAALCVVRDRFTFFEAWQVTRGRQWALIGSYLIVWLIFTMISLTLFSVFAFAMFGQHFGSLLQLSETSTPQEVLAVLGAMFAAPGAWVAIGVYAVISMILSSIFWIFVFGVSARAAIAGVEDGKIDGMTESVAKTFE